jgi:hypothetical protein
MLCITPEKERYQQAKYKEEYPVSTIYQDMTFSDDELLGRADESGNETTDN